MLHRIMVRLYDENPMDAEVLDYLSDFDGKRRQDILRTLIRMGFNTLNSASGKKVARKVAEEDASALIAVAEAILSDPEKASNKARKPESDLSHGSNSKAKEAPVRRAEKPSEAIQVDTRKFIASQLESAMSEESEKSGVEIGVESSAAPSDVMVENKEQNKGSGESGASDISDDDFNPLSALAKKFS